MRRNVLAMSGRAVEAAGDVDVLLLDKTGTITFGNRRASELLPLDGVGARTWPAPRSRRRWPTRRPRGAASSSWSTRPGPGRPGSGCPRAELVAFSASTRMSGIDLDGRRTRKGAASAVRAWVVESGGAVPAQLDDLVQDVSASGGTPLVVAERVGEEPARVLGVVHLKDVVKDGIVERFAEMRAMGIRTVMITGDNEVTARAIAAEAGVDDVLAEATPEDKLALIRAEQEGGRMVAMCGDGTNDAPALAQADVGVAMNTGTTAAKRPATWSTSTPTRRS